MPYIKEEIQLKLSGQNIDWPLYELIIPSIFMVVCILFIDILKRGQVRSATYILFGSSFLLITLVYTFSFHKIIKESILKIEPEKRPYNLLRLKVDKEVFMIVKSHRSSEFEKI